MCLSFVVMASLPQETNYLLNKRLHVISYIFQVWVLTCDAYLLRGDLIILLPPPIVALLVLSVPMSCYCIISP